MVPIFSGSKKNGGSDINTHYQYVIKNRCHFLNMARSYGIEYLEKTLSHKNYSPHSYGAVGSFYVKYCGKVDSLIKKIKRCGLDAIVDDRAEKILLVISKDGPGLDIMRAYAKRHFAPWKK